MMAMKQEGRRGVLTQSKRVSREKKKIEGSSRGGKRKTGGQPLAALYLGKKEKSIFFAQGRGGMVEGGGRGRGH